MENNILGLYIPNQRLGKSDAPYANPKEAEQWIQELPIAHVGETSRLVYKALAEINRISMPVNQRFKLMECYRKPVEYVTASLEKHYVGQPFPLSLKNQKIAELTRELQWEMAIGYKIIVDANLSGFAQRVDGKVLLASIHRAMYYLSQTLLKAYQIYSPPQEHAWLELHHLFLFTAHNKLENQPLKDKLSPKGTAGSVADIYKQILLLTVANPYRLPQLEIARVYDALAEWTKHATLVPLESMSPPMGLFMVDMEKDKPPTYFHEPDKAEYSKHKRILDTSSLTRVIRDALLEAEAPPTYEKDAETGFTHYETGLKAETLRRLILAWGAIPKRNFSRTGKNVKTDVALGLSATHFFLEKDSSVDDDKTRVSQRLGNRISYGTKATFSAGARAEDTMPDSSFDVWDVADNPSLQVTSEFEVPSFFDTTFETQPAIEKKQAEKDPYDSYGCILVNESAGGFCLAWDKGVPTKTMVGTLIGVRNKDQDDARKWSIGVIRWMKSDSDKMYLGVELLAPKAEPVAAKSVSHKAKVPEYMRCLLLPELRTVNQPQTLITPSLYRIGERLKLVIKGQTVKVKLTKLLESTSTFSQFQFSILKSVEKVSPTDKLDRIKNFDSIWTSI